MFRIIRKRSVLLILIAANVLITKSDSDQDTSKDKIFFNPKIPKDTFVDKGSPLITTEFELLFNRNSLTFVPNYFVLEQLSENGDNAYVFLENISDATFHLYGEKHPNYPHYQIEVHRHLTVQKCETTEKCEKTKNCEHGLIDNERNLTLSKKVVYISLKKVDGFVTILVQYKDKLIKCNDYSQPYPIRKLVMSGTNQQTIASSKSEFSYIKKVDSWTFSETFNLAAEKYVYMPILQCIHCKMNFGLECKNFTKNYTTDNYNSLNVNFDNSLSLRGWIDVVLPDKSDPAKTYNNCIITIYTEYLVGNSIDFPFEKFWFIGTSVGNIFTTMAKNETTTTTTTTEPTSESTTSMSQSCVTENKKCKCTENIVASVESGFKEMRIYNKLIIMFIIVVPIVVIILSFLTKNRRCKRICRCTGYSPVPESHTEMRPIPSPRRISQEETHERNTAESS